MAKIPTILEAGRADGKLIKTDSVYDDNQEKFLSDKIEEIDSNHNALIDIVNNNELDIEKQNQEIASFKETITNQVDNFRPIVIEGNVTNAPDEEDITTDESNLLKFANRGTLDGM